MLRILLGVIYFVLLAIEVVFFSLGIKSLKKSQKNDDALYHKAVSYFKLFILTEVVKDIFSIICFILLS